jgi:uncharacterized protein (DUF1697 family)
MTKYAVFLRGINVGGRVVRMAELKICLERAGLREVITLLQSGNVIFESNVSQVDLKPLIEGTLTETFGYPAKVQVFTIDNLRKIVESYPFGTAGNNRHDYVIFIENGLEKALVGESYELAPGEKVKAGVGVVYWRVDKGSTLKSSFAKLLTKTKYKNFNTNRNLKTIQRLLNS